MLVTEQESALLKISSISSQELVDAALISSTNKGKACPIKSQNHRITGVGRDLKRTSSPTPLLKQVPYNRLHR